MSVSSGEALGKRVLQSCNEVSFWTLVEFFLLIAQGSKKNLLAYRYTKV